MKRTLGICLIVCAVVACKKDGGGDAKPPDLPPSRAAAAGDFPDNPQLANVPAETPYAFATFKPLPLDYIRKFNAVFTPVINKMRTSQDPGSDRMRAVLDEIGTFDVKHFEELGFSAKARAVIYGIGVYPVIRIEIADGDKVFGFVQRVAKRWGNDLPPPTEQNGHRHWIIDSPKDVAVLVALTKTEMVFALAPRPVLDQNLALVLGDQKPAKAIQTSQFKDVAQRDGFSSQGVGFIDTARLIGGVMDISGADKPSDACRAAIEGLAHGAPRLGFGYDDLSGSKISFGAVLELAPKVLADAKTLPTTIAGLDRLMKSKPVIGMAGAVDLAHARALVPKISATMRDIGAACQIPDAADAADKLETKVGRALPPFVDGPTGAVFSMSDLKIGAMGPEKMEGYAVIHVKDTAPLLQLASSQLPGMDLTADGKAHALPSMLPFKGHFAINGDTIALALGADSSSKATDVLGDKPTTAPLWFMVFDYQRMGDMMGQSADPADLAMFKLFGLGVFQVGIDDRGLFTWMSIEVK